MHHLGPIALFLLFYDKQLFHQYLVNVWAACNQNKYDWIRSYQKNLGTDLYNCLANTLIQTDTGPLNSYKFKKRDFTIFFYW